MKSISNKRTKRAFQAIIVVLICDLAGLAVSSHAGSAAFADQDAKAIIPGSLIDKLVCREKPEQSYALYLPSHYTADRKWPILYAFDPGARGKVPVEHYQEAAEKFGWIVVGSNNSRNGAWQPSVDAWTAMTNDTHERFSIDDARIYVSGFSGGARVALTFASACRDCIAGVIASGAGFPPSIQPAQEMRFAFYGTTGIDDFNFAELNLLEEQLSKAGIKHHIEVFEGRHEWPPSRVAVDALAWMELDAMALGKIERDAKRIDDLWKTRMSEANAFEEARKPYDAYQIYLDMSNSFRGLREVSAVESRVKELRNTAAVRDAIRDEQQQIKRQRDVEAQLSALIAAGDRTRLQQDSQPGDDPPIDPTVRLHELVSALRRQSVATQDSSARRVARRVLEGVYIGLFERASNLLQVQQRYDEAVRVLTAATEINPDRPGGFYFLAWAQAGKGEKKKALQALKTAVEKGFSDRASLSSNRAFDSLRENPEFVKIVETIRP